MSINKPTADSIRLEGSVSSIYLIPSGTITCWFRATAWDASGNNFIDCSTSGVRGFLIRWRGTGFNYNQGFWADDVGGNNNWRGNIDGGIGLNTWVFAAIVHDDSVPEGIAYHAEHGIGDTMSTRITALPNNSATSGALSTPTLMNNTAANQEHTGDLADLRVYNRVLSPEEIDIIYYSQGKDSIIDGLITRVGFPEHSPGTTVSGASTYPIDLADSSQSWSPAGTGDAISYNDCELSLTKRRR